MKNSSESVIMKRSLHRVVPILLCILCLLMVGCASSASEVQNPISEIDSKESSEIESPSREQDTVDDSFGETKDKLSLSTPENYTSQGTGIIENSADLGELYASLDIIDVDDSTCFSAVGYSANNEIFYCKFLDGGSEYIYLDVPETIYQELLSADSKGGFYNAQIKSNYECMKIGK